MKLVVGLGNPGSEYAGTRHNIGFEVTEAVRVKHGLPAWAAKCKGLVSKGKIGAQDVVLLMPQTFMNLSGDSVQAARAFYKIEVSDVFVVHDELDLPTGALRTKVGGGDAGHNGLKSITACLGTPEYGRLRFGIDRPAHKAMVSDYVLHRFDDEELPLVEKRVKQLADNFAEILDSPVAALARIQA